MVNLTLLLGAVALVAFFASGGLKKADAFLGSDFVGQNQKDTSGEVVVDNLQNNPSIPIPEGSQTTVATIQASEIIRTDISSKRKLNQNASKPMIKTTFFDRNSGGSEPQAGTIRSTQGHGGFRFGVLTTKQVGDIRSQPFTRQEEQDIVNLRSRFNQKSISSQKVSDSPEEIVFKKREQEAIAKMVLGNKNFVEQGGQQRLFANPNFDIGLPSDASEQDIQLAIQQRQERDQVLLKLVENRALRTQQQTTGAQILSTIAKSGLNQKQFLREQAGVNLQGGNTLNARALAKLRAKGINI